MKLKVRQLLQARRRHTFSDVFSSSVCPAVCESFCLFVFFHFHSEGLECAVLKSARQPASR